MGTGPVMTGWSWYISSFPRSFWGWPEGAGTCKGLKKLNNNKKKSTIDHIGRNLYLILIPNSVTDQNDLTQVYQ
jgi:hypothetical protein